MLAGVFCSVLTTLFRTHANGALMDARYIIHDRHAVLPPLFCSSRHIVKQLREARRVIRKASLYPARLQLPQRLADGASLGDTPRDHVGPRKRQAWLGGLDEKFARPRPFALMPREGIGLRQEDRVDSRLAAMAEEQAQQFLRAWRLVEPVQAAQRARGGFETLSFRVGQTQPLAQALGVFG